MLKEIAKRKLNSKWEIGIPALISVAFALGMCIRVSMDKSDKISLFEVQKGTIPADDKFEAVKFLLENEYISNINMDSLEQNAIENLVNGLDPYSSYFNPKQFGYHEEEIQGKYRGIGIEFFKIKDTFYVAKIIPNGPASKTSLQKGDIIVSVDGKALNGKAMNSSDLVDKIRGEEGSDINLGILNVQNQKKEIIMQRGAFSISPVEDGIKLKDNVVYIKINQFTTHVYQEFMQKLEKCLDKNKPTHLILDLRNNPGGILQEVTKILCQLVPEKDKILVYTKGAHQTKNEYKTNGKAFYNLGKLVVLINENSASASEILAGSLQDLDKATIIGRASFGKGLVQADYPMNDGSALKLTISNYFLPSGRSIQKLQGKYAFNSGFQDSAKVFYSAQGRKLPSGSGIIPDILIGNNGLDTMWEVSSTIKQLAFSKARKDQFMKRSDFFNAELEEIGRLYPTTNKLQVLDAIKLEYASFCLGVDKSSLASSDVFVTAAMQSLQR